jgi:diguanylate cyclase (GGDEF)-like protein
LSKQANTWSFIGKNVKPLIKFIFISCLYLISDLLHAQNSELKLLEFEQPYLGYLLKMRDTPDDVLRQLLDNPPKKKASPLTHAQYFSTLGKAYHSLTYPQKSLHNARLALTFISLDTQPWLTHNLRINESLAYEMLGQFTAGLAGVNEAIVWAEDNNDLQTLLAGLAARGMIYNSLTSYSLALIDFQRAYSLAPQNDSSITRADIAGMQAQVYEYRGEPKLSIPLFEEAEQVYRKNENWVELSIVLFGLGKANRDVGEFDLGKAQLQESMELAKKINDRQGVAYALNELAGMNIHSGHFSLAQQQLTEAYEIVDSANNHFLTFNLLTTLSKLYFKQDKLQLAQEYFDLAGEALHIENMPLQNIHYEEYRASILAKQNKDKQAYKVLRAAYTDYKKYTNTESSEQLHRIRVKSELEMTQKQNLILSHKNELQKLQLQNQKEERTNLFVIVFLTLCACTLLIILIYRSKHHNRTLKQLANIDELTGLANRRQVFQHLQSQLVLKTRYNTDLCVAMVDIDWFKIVNDKFGHFTGDKVLRLFATLCLKNLRQTDFIGRVGGEEFLIILPQTSTDDAYQVMEKLRLAMSEISKEVNMPELNITISVGITECFVNDTRESITQIADLGLYRAKENGRNQVVVCDRREQQNLV